MAKESKAAPGKPGDPAPGFCVMQAPANVTSITIPVGPGQVDTKVFQVVNGKVECSEDFMGVLAGNGFTTIAHTPAAPPAPAEGATGDTQVPANTDGAGDGAGDGR